MPDESNFDLLINILYNMKQQKLNCLLISKFHFPQLRMLRQWGQKPHRHLHLRHLKGSPTAKSSVRSGDWWQIYLDETSRKAKNPVLSSRPALHLVSFHMPQNSLFIMGTQDASSSRKLKTGEVLETPSCFCLQTVVFFISDS